MPRTKRTKRSEQYSRGASGRNLGQKKYWGIVCHVFDNGDGDTNVKLAKTIKQEIAMKYRVDIKTIERTLKRFNDTGEAVPARFIDRKNKIRGFQPKHERFLRSILQDDPALFLREMRVLMEAKFKELGKVTLSRLCRGLHSIKMSYKVLQHVAAERCEKEVAEHLLAIRHYPAQNIVFIDESHFDNKTQNRRRGRSKAGTPAERRTRLGPSFRASLLAAVGCNGLLIKACKLVEENVNYLVFIRWVKESLLPNLPPGTILVLDNAAIHHHDEVKLCLTNAIADPNCNLCRLLFLPPYCPMLNPIERCFAQIKAFLRSFCTNNYSSLKRCIDAALHNISTSNTRKYYRAAHLNIATYEQEETEANASWWLQVTAVFFPFLNYSFGDF